MASEFDLQIHYEWHVEYFCALSCRQLFLINNITVFRAHAVFTDIHNTTISINIKIKKFN